MADQALIDDAKRERIRTSLDETPPTPGGSMVARVRRKEGQRRIVENLSRRACRATLGPYSRCFYNDHGKTFRVVAFGPAA